VHFYIKQLSLSVWMLQH